LVGFGKGADGVPPMRAEYERSTPVWP
jgi:hypothetical protein